LGPSRHLRLSRLFHGAELQLTFSACCTFTAQAGHGLRRFCLLRMCFCYYSVISAGAADYACCGVERPRIRLSFHPPQLSFRESFHGNIVKICLTTLLLATGWDFTSSSWP